MCASLLCLFAWPTTLAPCFRRQIASICYRIFEEADPGKTPRSQDTGRKSTSMMFLRSLLVETTVVGQQSGGALHSLIQQISGCVESLSYVAMGPLPS